MKKLLFVFFSIFIFSNENIKENKEIWVSPYIGFTSSTEFDYFNTFRLFWTPVSRLNSYNFGFDVEYEYLKNIYISVGFNYLTRGVSTGSFVKTDELGKKIDSIGQSSIEYQNLLFPIKVKYEKGLFENLNMIIELGFYLSYVSDRKLKYDGVEEQSEVDYFKYDLGSIYSAGINYKLSENQKIGLIFANYIGIKAPVSDLYPISNSLNLVYSFKI